MSYIPLPTTPYHANGVMNGNLSVNIAEATATLQAASSDPTGMTSWSGSNASRLTIVRTGAYMFVWTFFQNTLGGASAAGWNEGRIYRNGTLVATGRGNPSTAVTTNPSVFFYGTLNANDYLELKGAAWANGLTYVAASSPWELTRYSIQSAP